MTAEWVFNQTVLNAIYFIASIYNCLRRGVERGLIKERIALYSDQPANLLSSQLVLIHTIVRSLFHRNDSIKWEYQLPGEPAYIPSKR